MFSWDCPLTWLRTVAKHRPTRVAYSTLLGKAFHSRVEEFLVSGQGAEFAGEVKLLLTSPPFPLLAKKRYGNLQGNDYLDWITKVFGLAVSLLRPDGSLVVEIGNAWDPGQPSMSTLPLRSLIAIAESSGLSVCQQFVCHNPARLPGPAAWVTVRRLRVKDAFTHVWWFAKDPWLESDNRKVVQPYSNGMQRLLRDQKYNAGMRPSEHRINGTSFLADNGGAIPSNVLSFANTSDAREYVDWCRTSRLKPHPARMPRGLADFFIDFLTDEGDLVADCFAGSNVVGASAEAKGRRWLAIEERSDYLIASMGRFRRRASRLRAFNPPFKDQISRLPA
jgi:hypothetical protein